MKTYRKLRPESLLLMFAAISIISIATWACRRELKPNKRNKDKITMVKNWFNKKYGQTLAIGSNGKLLNGNKYPEWRFIKTYNYKGLEIMEMPVLEAQRKVYTLHGEGIAPGANASLNKLLIARNHLGGYRETIMTVIPHKEYFDSRKSLESITLNNMPQDFSGLLLFHDWNGKYLNGYVIASGKASNMLRLSNKAPDAGNTTESFGYDINIHCLGCDLIMNTMSDQVYSWICPPDVAVNPCADMYLVTGNNDCGGDPNPFNCPCIENQIQWDMCGFDDGGGGTNFDPYQAPEITISDSLRDSFPCLYHLLRDSLPNLNREAQMELFSNFNVSKKINLRFDIDWSMDSTNTIDAYTDYQSSGSDNYEFNALIRFNPFYIKNGTKEYTVSTIVHEAIHAYIGYMFDAYTRNVPGIDSNYLAQHFPIHWNHFKKRPVGENLQHRLMAEHYVNTIQNITRLFYNPSADTATANKVSRALAWSGLGKTVHWKNLSDSCDVKAMFWTARNINRSTSGYNFGNQCRTYNLHYFDSLKLSQPCR